IGGAMLVYLLLSRLLGHWTWGLAGGLLWLAQPDTTDTIQIRPDVLLCALLLSTGYVVVRAWQRRSAAAFAAAAAIAGFALMTKLHAVAIIPMILLATVLGYPGADWRQNLKAETRSFVARHRTGVAIAVAVWVLLFFLLNWHRISISTLGIDSGLLAAIAFVVFDYWLITTLVHKWVRNRLLRRVFDPFYLWLAGAFAIGVAIPLALVREDSPWILSQTFLSLIGRNVNAGITPFKLSVTQFTSFPLLEAMIVIALSLVAAVVGILRRDALPVIWFVGAGAMTLLATVRLGENRYYAPGYILAVPAALWLFRRRGTVAAPVVVWVLVVGVLVPTFLHMRSAAHAAKTLEAQSRATTALADRVLSPDQVALVPSYYSPVADARWWGLVHQYVFSPPDYPYRFIPDEADAIPAATDEGKHVAAYVGSAALDVGKPQPLQLGSGPYEAAPVPGGRDYAFMGLGVVRLLSGPGT
ncbi:MAG TPA: glycosyltransferase family 39 protein, partial [Gaiellaceae bacterium]